MVQGFLDSNSTFHLFLLSETQIRGKGGHLVSVRKVEATNQCVHRTGCDKASGENPTLDISEPQLIISFLIITIEVVIIKVIIQMSGTTQTRADVQPRAGLYQCFHLVIN